MRVIVRKSAVEPALLDTKDATSIELRDANGKLFFALLTLSGESADGSLAFHVMSINDKDFDKSVRGFGLEP